MADYERRKLFDDYPESPSEEPIFTGLSDDELKRTIFDLNRELEYLDYRVEHEGADPFTRDITWDAVASLESEWERRCEEAYRATET